MKNHAIGFGISAAAGIIAAVVIWVFVEKMVDVWYFGTALGPLIGVSLGGLLGFRVYTHHLRQIGVPVGPIAVSAKGWSAARWAFISLAVVVTIGHLVNTAKRAARVDQYAAGAHGFQLVMPANGDSPHVSAPGSGYAPSFTGYGFMSHCVYTDGRDLSYPCVPGPIVYYYVHDLSGRANAVTYTFVRP